MKKKFASLGKKKLIKLAAIFLATVLLFALIFDSCQKKKGAMPVGEFAPHTVTRGNITVSVTGSGTVTPNEQYEIQSLVTGDILEDNVTLGESVKKDDVLYVIDSSSAVNSIERSETNYEQQVISYNDKLRKHNEEVSARSVTASSGGYISELYVENGDKVSNGTKLAEIRNSEYLTVRVPFLAGNAKNISENQSATVYIDDRNESHTGYVSHVATGTYATEAGAIVSDIEITFKNPGALLPGESVTATVGTFACNDIGRIENSETEVITAEAAGTVTNLSYSKGDNIKKGKQLLYINDDSSGSDMRSNELSLKNAKLSLDDQIEKLNDYTIRAPIDGTVISKTMKAGDTLDGNKTSLAIVADMSQLTFEMSIDELYIKDISVGQKVEITADALPNKHFTGIVDTVSIIGDSVSGVTVYPITVVIPEYEGLLPGMNVNAEIIIKDVQNVLVIPQNAVSRGNLVLVKDDGKAPEAGKKGDDKENNMRLPEAPEGYKYIRVTTGEANDDFVEIVDGLSEGDTVYTYVLKNTTQAQAGFGAFGGGGGMPMGGGMPGGMTGSGNRTGGMPSGMTGGGNRTGGMPSGMTGGGNRTGGMSGGGMR